MDGWSRLLPDLLHDIDERLLLYVDKFRIRSVCISWKSNLPNLKSPKDFNFPCLLHPLTLNKTIYLPDKDCVSWEREWEESGSDRSDSDRSDSEESEAAAEESEAAAEEGEAAEEESEAEEEGEAAEEEGEAPYGLLCPDEKKVYHLDMPRAKGVFFIGSSYGWVVAIPDIINGNGSNIYLLNPLTNACIHLPPRHKFPDIVGYCRGRICPKTGDKAEYKVSNDGENFYVLSYNVNLHQLDKVVLSSTPLSQDWVAIAIYGELGSLAYCKCNDTEWKCLSQQSGFRDVIFHKGKLHAVHNFGHVLVFENIGEDPKLTQIPSPGGPIPGLYTLVESCAGELFLATRHHRKHISPNNRHIFVLYKLDPDNSTWVQTRNIGDEMLFLGSNSSLAVSSRDFPRHKGNRIYFTDDNFTFSVHMHYEGVFVGVFNLEDQCCESLSGYNYVPKRVWPPPLWMTPSTF